MNPLQQQVDALQATVAALTSRVQAVESRGTLSAPGEPMDNYGQAIQEQLGKKREEQNGKYAVAVSNFVTQMNDSGSIGTAYSLVTVDQASDLPDDAGIETTAARVRLLVSDTLVLRCLREFVALAFEGQPMEATSADLAARLGSDAAQIEAVLEPLVQNKTLRRGLRTDNTAFFIWDGNSHIAMTLLFRS